MSLLRALLLLLASLIAVPAAAADSVTAASPDGRLVATFSIDGSGAPRWALARDGKPLIAASALGFVLTDREPMRRGFAIAGSETASADRSWEQPWGERRFVRDRHNELLVRFTDTLGYGRAFAVRIRLFDDGIGFRYELPALPNDAAWHIADELTEFTLASDGTAWWIPAFDWNREEYLYHQTAISAVPVAQTPMTVRLADGTHLAFHEAALVDYSGMWLQRVEALRFKAMLSPAGTAARVTRTGAFATPWRTLRIADSAAALYDNDLELNLNEPSRIADTGWIKPMKYLGIWWEMHLGRSTWGSGPTHGANTANALRHIDFAAKNGFGGLLIEGWNQGWDGDWFGHGDFSFTKAYPDFDLPRIAAYAKSKRVRLIGHHETGGNIANYEDQLEDAMALYERLGVDAVKTGYVADAGGIIARAPDGGQQREWHEGQRSVQHHLRVVEAAARHRIAVDAHEPVKDTGLRRTWPNWVSREGARGMEYNAWGNPDNGPDHEPILVFTRMLSGPMDFTPGVFSLAGKAGNFLSSTLARQLALYIVLYSPIQMAADLPENLAKFPRELAFVRDLPADWAETKTLMGEVGAYVVQARQDRASAAWYLGGITNGEARAVSVPLDFLPAGRRFKAIIYRDGPEADYRTAHRHDIVIEERLVTAADSLALRMGPAGGFAVRLAPAK